MVEMEMIYGQVIVELVLADAQRIDLQRRQVLPHLFPSIAAEEQCLRG